MQIYFIFENLSFVLCFMLDQMFSVAGIQGDSLWQETIVIINSIAEEDHRIQENFLWGRKILLKTPHS